MAAPPAELSETLKRLEADGYVFEAADASLELLMRRASGWEHDFFSVEAYRVSAYHREGLASPTNGVDLSTEATVKLWVDDERLASVGEGNGPVNALDAAVRAALTERYPALTGSTSSTSRSGCSTASPPTGRRTRPRSCGS